MSDAKPDRNLQRAARDLARKEGIPYQTALRHCRDAEAADRELRVVVEDLAAEVRRDAGVTSAPLGDTSPSTFAVEHARDHHRAQARRADMIAGYSRPRDAAKRWFDDPGEWMPSDRARYAVSQAQRFLETEDGRAPRVEVIWFGPGGLQPPVRACVDVVSVNAHSTGPQDHPWLRVVNGDRSLSGIALADVAWFRRVPSSSRLGQQPWPADLSLAQLHAIDEIVVFHQDATRAQLERHVMHGVGRRQAPTAAAAMRQAFDTTHAMEAVARQAAQLRHHLTAWLHAGQFSVAVCTRCDRAVLVEHVDFGHVEAFGPAAHAACVNG